MKLNLKMLFYYQPVLLHKVELHEIYWNLVGGWRLDKVKTQELKSN